MKKNILFASIIFLSFLVTFKAKSQDNQDELRKTEIDKTYWNLISKTVKEGNFEGYSATCHKNSILVNAVGKNKVSYPMQVALAGWKKGFMNTKLGKQRDELSFRFSQRIGDKTTAHETGIFYFTSHDSKGKLIAESFIHFESLLIKQGGKWMCLMEYQKAEGTRKDWDAIAVPPTKI